MANLVTEITVIDSPDGSTHQAHGGFNGQQLTIAYPQTLSADEQRIIHDSDQAFTRLKATWSEWKKVRAGLVLIREVAMRESRADNLASKRYKNRFHELLEQRSYCNISKATRNALFDCAQRAPGIDEWHDRLDADRRLQLNHPVNVLEAYKEARNTRPKQQSGFTERRRARPEAEFERIIKDHAAAIATKDARIEELEKRAEVCTTETFNSTPSTKNSHPADIESIVRYVLAKCSSPERIRAVVDALTAHLERAPS